MTVNRRERAFSFRPVFRDAIGRTINRRAKNRTAQDIEAIFSPALLSIGLALESKIPAVFLTEYCAEMADRAQLWTHEGVEKITETELTRAIDALKSY